MLYEIKPIRLEEWLPDRCMPAGGPIDPAILDPEPGCHSLNQCCTKGSRDRLVELYTEAVGRAGCCGFIAWTGDRIAGYNTFFPREMAVRMRFFGWGKGSGSSTSTLVHHCISITQNSKYRRQGIGTDLIARTLDWSAEQGWERFEVHMVLPDTHEGYTREQKSCRSFWERFGFEVTRTFEADPDTRVLYGVGLRFSMRLELRSWREWSSSI